MTQSPPIDREDLANALRDPTSIFASPREVIERRDWTPGERREVLEQWRQDAEHLATSAWENMAGGEPSRLQEVLHALRALDADEGSDR